MKTLTPPIPLRTTPARVDGTVVVLGGSIDQLGMIRTIRQKGLRALVLDSNPQALGRQEADDFAPVSSRDVPAIVEFCRHYHRDRIVGVTTAGSDIPHIMAGVGSALDLPAVSPETGRLGTHKYLMKERFAECGVPIPWFGYVSSATDLQRLAEERDYQIIMKPVDASGSFGVFHPRPEDDLALLFERTAGVGKVGRVMVEEYITGPQISTETILVDERSYTPTCARRNYDQRDWFRPQIMENGAEQPGGFTPEQVAACAELATRAGRALGITRGIAKGDLVIHPERGPMVIEIAARISAGSFADGTIPVATGVNILDAVVDLATGCDPDVNSLTPDRQRAAALRFFFPAPGSLQAIEGIEASLQHPWLRLLRLNASPGDEIADPVHHGKRAGIFIVEGETRQEALDRADEIYQTIQFHMAPAPLHTNPVTDDSLRLPSAIHTCIG